MEHRILPPPLIALTIAGHDPSSGAGISADLQVLTAHGHFGVSAITALTIQSTLGVASVEPVSGQVLTRVLDHLTADLSLSGIKIGMMGTSEVILSVADFLSRQAPPSKPQIPYVLDPVLSSSSGASLLEPSGLELFCGKLLPLVSWITPNWAELALLTGRPVTTMSEAEAAAHILGSAYPHLYVVVTGGDQPVPTDLLRLRSGELHHLPGERLETTSTHGTGCAFSSALLANLILKKTPLEAVLSSKKYVFEAIRRAPAIGHGRGPLNLLWPLQPNTVSATTP